MGYGRKRSWRNLKYYLGICLDRPRKTMQNVSQDNWSSNREQKTCSSKHYGMLTTGLLRSVYSGE
jgi:hypothetical protein